MKCTPLISKRKSTIPLLGDMSRRPPKYSILLPIPAREVSDGRTEVEEDDTRGNVITPRAPYHDFETSWAGVGDSDTFGNSLLQRSLTARKARRSSYGAAYLLLSKRCTTSPSRMGPATAIDRNLFPAMVLDQSLRQGRERILIWLLASVSAKTTIPVSVHTFYLASSLYDKYILSKLANGTRPTVLKQEFELLGITSLFVASKMEDSQPLQIDDIFDVFQNLPIKKHSVIAFERTLLAELDYEVHNTYTYTVDQLTETANSEVRLGMRLMSELLILNAMTITVDQTVLAEEATRLVECVLGHRDYTIVKDDDRAPVSYLCIAVLASFMTNRIERKGSHEGYELCWRVNANAFSLLKHHWRPFLQSQKILKRRTCVTYLVDQLNKQMHS